MMDIRVPDFVIGGAPRSGTTWLWYLLDRHPDVYMAKPLQPEPKFFLVDQLYELGMDYYMRTWFHDVDDNQICGEKSTNYLESPTAATRIYKQLPGIKLIFILREPVDRAFSNYLWSRMNGLEDKDFATALALEEKREQEVQEDLKYARPHALFSRGLYAQLLQVYFDLFPKKQILCLRYEDIIKKPESLAERLHLFLGLSPRPQDTRSVGVINPSRKESLEIPGRIREMLQARYAESNRRLAELLGPEFDMWEV